MITSSSLIRRTLQRNSKHGFKHTNTLKTATTVISNIRNINASALKIQKIEANEASSKPLREDLVFGSHLSDHMLTITWNQDDGWSSPLISPTEDLKLSPAASALHYGLQCFEGMKAYRTLDGSDELRLFRPDKNMQRLKKSMDTLSMPSDWKEAELLECIKQLVSLDREWVPRGEGYSLYIRPTVIATHPFLGLAAPASIMVYCITSPVGPYYKSGFKPVRLTADVTQVRAWPGGTGNSKVGGNYAPSIKPSYDASKRGYSQILWLFGENKEITEVGSMNVFFVIKNPNTGRIELITPPLSRGDILPGVTRQSIIDLANTWEEIDVVERFPTITEVAKASAEGRVLEAFGAGTAAVVTPISCIEFGGVDIDIPATGAITQKVWDNLTGIQYGLIEGPTGWSVKI